MYNGKINKCVFFGSGMESWSKTEKKRNKAKVFSRKPRPNPEVELAAWPGNPKSWEVFQGQCQEQPQTKVRKLRFSMATGISKVTEGRFLETCSTQIVKSKVFQRQETLFEESSLPEFIGQTQINRGAINCKSAIMSFTTVRMTFSSVKVLEPHDLRRMKTN